MNNKNTKRALFASAMSMLLCVSMLIGSTFAWFTDTAKTNVCTIQSGELDVQLLDTTGETLEGKTLNFVDKDGKEANFLMEPNGTYQFESITIKNDGDFNLKYKIQVTGIDGNAKLLNVLSWEYILGNKSGILNDNAEFKLAPNEAHTLTIKVTMNLNADNEYMNQSIEGIAINVLATQDTGDFDSFEDQYDSLATYPTLPGTPEPTPDPDAPVEVVAGTVAELKEAFEAAASGSSGDMIITLSKNFDAANAWEAFSPKGYNGVNKIVIEGNGHTIKNLNEPLMVGSFAGSGSITINDLIIEKADISHERYNNLGLGAFVAYSDASGGVTLNNCKLVDSKVNCTDGYAGGLIGYTSTQATISDCSVSGSTITGGNSSGAIAGQFAAPATVSNCTITGNTVSYANGADVDKDDWRVGVVVGTANVGTVSMEKITKSNNTLMQGTVTAPDHSELYGRNKGATITLDGNAI